MTRAGCTPILLENKRIRCSEYKGRTRPVRFGVQGMADIVAFPWFKGETHPRILWIEVKGERGRQRPEQKSFADQVREDGMEYLLAYSVDDVEMWLKAKAATR